jgi:Holliday junction resolvase RusA-like endonuclease
MTAFALTIYGAPRTKKTHNRLVWVKGKPRVLPSKQWARWVTSAVIVTPAMDGKVMIDGRLGRVFLGVQPLTTRPVCCCARFYRDADRGDLVGYQQGLADLLEKRGVLKNDRQIVSWDGSRLLKDATHPRVELWLKEVAA